MSQWSEVQVEALAEQLHVDVWPDVKWEAGDPEVKDAYREKARDHLGRAAVSGVKRRWTIWNVSKRFTVEKVNASPITLGDKVEVMPVSEHEEIVARLGNACCPCCNEAKERAEKAEAAHETLRSGLREEIEKARAEAAAQGFISPSADRLQALLEREG